MRLYGNLLSSLRGIKGSRYIFRGVVLDNEFVYSIAYIVSREGLSVSSDQAWRLIIDYTRLRGHKFAIDYTRLRGHRFRLLVR